MTTDLAVVFEAPSAGGITVRISTSGAWFEQNVSHIYPSLERLCSSIHDLGARNEASCVTFLLEPAEIVLQFDPMPNGASRLSVIVVRDSFSGKRRDEVLSHAAPARDLVLIFWRALRRLQTSLSAVEFERAWGTPFPELEMASLTELMESWKTK